MAAKKVHARQLLNSIIDSMSYLQAAKRGLRNVRPSRWINLMLSFLSTTSLLSERCLSSIDRRTLGAAEEKSAQSQIIQAILIKIEIA